MKTVFITGTTGLLGTNLVHKLLAEGYGVIGLVRNKSAYRGMEHPNLELIEGTLFSDLTEVLQKVDIVVHAAAETRQSLTRYSQYYNVNRNATVLLYNTSVHCNVGHFIFISSANTSGYGTKENPGVECSPVRSPFDRSLYSRSKVEAENYILNSSNAMKVTVLNPTFMIGAWDSKPSSGKIILMVWKKRIALFPPGGKNFVHVEDVADAVIRCAELGISGEKYIISGENLSYREFFTKVTEIAQQKTLLIQIPKLVMLVLGYLGECIRLAGIETSIGITNMKILCINNFYCNNKSVRDLGLNYREIVLAISDALDYFNKDCLKSKI